MPRTAAEIQAELKKLRPYWYSPFDLGDGVVTGDRRKKKRFQRRMRLLEIPNDLRGKRALDIGSWDGYWALELERRGADVFCIDTWDDPEQLAQFKFIKEHFGAKMQFKQLDVQDLDPSAAGLFDVVFCAGALYHLRYPLNALERIRSVTKELLILETVAMKPFFHESFPMMAFFPGDREACSSGRLWGISGAATISWLREALLSAGFKRVEVRYKPSFGLWRKFSALIKNSPQGGRVVIHAYVN